MLVLLGSVFWFGFLIDCGVLMLVCGLVEFEFCIF